VLRAAAGSNASNDGEPERNLKKEHDANPVPGSAFGAA
jgi:hypothetical protein